MTSKQFRRNPIYRLEDQGPPAARARWAVSLHFRALGGASLRYLHRFHRCGPILAPQGAALDPESARSAARRRQRCTRAARRRRSKIKNERRPPHARARRDRARLPTKGLRRAAVAGDPGARRGRSTGRSRGIVRPGGRGQDVIITTDLRELVPAGLARRRM